MIDLGIYLLEHVDLASLVVVLGLVLDYVATQPLKSEALAWVRAGRFAVSLKHFLTGFLRGFIYRLFGKRLFSVRFFLKSSLISLVLLVIVVVLQAGYQRRPISQFTGIGPNTSVDLAVLFILLIVNFFIDYISNVQTIIFLRMAAATGRIADVIVAFYSDLIVTLAIFTFLFPVGIICSIAFLSYVGESSQLELSATSQDAHQWGYLFPKPRNPNTEFDLNFFTVRVSLPSQKEKLSWPSGTMYVYAKDAKAAVNAATELVVLKLPNTKIISQTDTNAVIETHVPHSNIIAEIKDLYVSAYRASNVTRDGFWGLLRLESVLISAATVSDQLVTDRIGNELKSIKCLDGTRRELSGDLLDKSEEGVELILPCDAATVVSDQVNKDEFLSLRMAVLPTAQLPITPFFMTSFSVSAFYYCAIGLSMIGVAMLRVVRLVSSTQYLDVENKPFTVLGILAFPIVLLVVFVLNRI